MINGTVIRNIPFKKKLSYGKETEQTPLVGSTVVVPIATTASNGSTGRIENEVVMWSREMAEPSTAELLLRKNLQSSAARGVSARHFLWSCSPADSGPVPRVISRMDAMVVAFIVALTTVGPTFAMYLPACLGPCLIVEGLTAGNIGTLLAASYISGIVGYYVSVHLFATYNTPNRPLDQIVAFAAVVICAFGGALFALGAQQEEGHLSDRLWLFYISRIFTGFGYALLEPCLQAMIARWMGRQPEVMNAMLFAVDALVYALAATAFLGLPSVVQKSDLIHALWGGMWLPSIVSFFTVCFYYVYSASNSDHLRRSPEAADEVLEMLGIKDDTPCCAAIPVQAWWQLGVFFFTSPGLDVLATFFPIILHRCGMVSATGAGRYGAAVFFAATASTLLSRGLDQMSNRVWLQSGLALAAFGTVFSLTQHRTWSSETTMIVVLSVSGIIMKFGYSAGLTVYGLVLPTGYDILGNALIVLTKYFSSAVLSIGAGYALDSVSHMSDTDKGLLPLMVDLVLGSIAAFAFAIYDRKGITELNPDAAVLEKERLEKESGHLKRGEQVTVSRRERRKQLAAWEDDATAEFCKLCGAKFSFTTRRHHCRACGGVFCAACTAHRIPLPKYGFGCLLRVCSTCYVRGVVDKTQINPNAIPPTTISSSETRRTDGSFSQLPSRTITGDTDASTPESRLPVSQFINYEDLKKDTWVELGHGSFGTVYKCEYTRVLEEVAVKELRDYSNDTLESFVDEMCHLNSLRYEHILTFYGWSKHDGRLFMVTALCQPGGLPQRLKVELSFEEYLDIALRISRAVLFLHTEGVVHQDLAARNILLTTSGDAKLGDLGLCTPIGGLSPIVPVLWSSPEALKMSNGERKAATHFDVWSFGVLLWEMLCVPTQCPFFWLLPDVQFERVAFLKLAKEIIIKGGTMPKPPGRPYAHHIYDTVIKACWNTDYKERVSMRQVVDQLRLLHEKARSEKSMDLSDAESPEVSEHSSVFNMDSGQYYMAQTQWDRTLMTSIAA